MVTCIIYFFINAHITFEIFNTCLYLWPLQRSMSLALSQLYADWSIGKRHHYVIALAESGSRCAYFSLSFIRFASRTENRAEHHTVMQPLYVIFRRWQNAHVLVKAARLTKIIPGMCLFKCVTFGVERVWSCRVSASIAMSYG